MRTCSYQNDLHANHITQKASTTERNTCCLGPQLPIAHARYVAVSATIPNVRDIAQWLHVPPEGLLVYGEDMRPVKLVTHVRGYAQTSNDFLFERRLNDYLPGIVTEFSKNKPSLIFCRCSYTHVSHPTSTCCEVFFQ